MSNVWLNLQQTHGVRDYVPVHLSFVFPLSHNYGLMVSIVNMRRLDITSGPDETLSNPPHSSPSRYHRLYIRVRYRFRLRKAVQMDVDPWRFSLNQINMRLGCLHRDVAVDAAAWLLQLSHELFVHQIQRIHDTTSDKRCGRG